MELTMLGSSWNLISSDFSSIQSNGIHYLHKRLRHCRCAKPRQHFQNTCVTLLPHKIRTFPHVRLNAHSIHQTTSSFAGSSTWEIVDLYGLSRLTTHLQDNYHITSRKFLRDTSEKRKCHLVHIRSCRNMEHFCFFPRSVHVKVLFLCFYCFLNAECE